MLPNTQTEGNPQQPTGGTEQPASQPSGQESQPLPDYVVALQNQVASLQAEIKGQQKGTDKRFGQMQGDIKRILELKDQGLNETQIQRELWIDSQIAQPREQSAQVQQAPGTSQPNTSLDVDGMIKSLKFADNDPVLAALRIKHAGNPQELVKAAADLRIQQLTSTGPTPGTGLSQTGGQGAGPINYDALAAEYDQLAMNPSANFERMTQIQAELDKIR